MMIAFQIILFIILLVSAMAVTDKSEVLRPSGHYLSLALASIVALCFTFWLGVGR
ncbi:Uncharacterised protein [Mycobacteroides abscessus subsp. abscessus]|nr:Uncharacterised protein [Mycobacteroides abscessus subsp. abscessus]